MAKVPRGDYPAPSHNRVKTEERFFMGETTTESCGSAWQTLPMVWKTFNLGERCHEARPLDERTRRLVKLALSVGAGLEGATHSAVRNARKSGITDEEISHVAVLGLFGMKREVSRQGFELCGSDEHVALELARCRCAV